jgi:transposase-like protein
MVSVAFSCPHCEEVERVRRHGKTKQGSERLYCVPCGRAFTLSPKSRSLSDEKAQMILNALAEKTPLTGICRTFKVSPNTVYALLKKG